MRMKLASLGRPAVVEKTQEKRETKARRRRRRRRREGSPSTRAPGA
jgi:hypothetical protein